jgi:hypothetical protein
MPEQQAKRHFAGLLPCRSPISNCRRVSRVVSGTTNCASGRIAFTDQSWLSVRKSLPFFPVRLGDCPATSANTGTFAGYGEFLAYGLFIRFHRNDVGQRVSNDRSPESVLFLVKRWLHREKCEHAVNRPPDFLDPPGAPGPDRRADIMNRLDTRCLKFDLEAQD